MNYNEFDPAGALTAEQPKTAQTRQIKAYETVFAWAALLLGYLFCRTLPVSAHPLGAFLLILALYTAGGIFLLLSHARQTPRSLFYLVSPLVLSASLFLSSNAFLHTCTFLWSLICFTFWVTLSYGGGLEANARELLFYDFLKAVFVMPFASFGTFFRSLFPRRKADGTTSGGKQVLLALLGLLIAVIPTAIVVCLLSYDQTFSDIMNKILRLSPDNLADHLVCLIFGIPVAAYGFGAFISGADRKHGKYMSAESCRKFSAGAKFAPGIMVCFAILPLLAVYCVFFVSQWENYVSAFTGRLPSGTQIYSQYARDGFFELCAVSGINAGIMLLVSAFTKRKNDGKPDTLVRIFTALLSLSTLILIATAISKTALYIKAYGLTQLRVYAAWFMILLAAAFVIMLIKQICPKTNAAASLLIAFVLLFGILALSNPDRLIAEYNVDRYLDGTLENPDVWMLANDCGDDAVPSLVRLCRELESRGEKDGVLYLKTLELLEEWNNKVQNSGFFSLTLPRLKAGKVYREYVAQRADG